MSEDLYACPLCGGEHESVGTIGGVKIIPCDRVKDFGSNVMGVSVSANFVDRLSSLVHHPGARCGCEECQ